ncbi:MAG: SRPBCC family protein [Alphaproteobacteria bacterium]|nr:SRPBCC family protein [Alphaproteobacteria bacterium]
MHRREAVFIVPTSPDVVWRFIRDFESLCACIPGVERLRRVDDATAELTVVEKVGVVPLRVELTARIDAEDPPHSLHAVATAEHVDIEIDVRLHAIGLGTELASLVQVTGRGPLKPVVDRLFERRATERTAQFAQSLKVRFGGAPESEAPARSPEGRLTHLWRQLLGWLGLR